MYESLRLEQRQSWQRGERVSIESYLQRFPDLASNPDALASLVEGEVSLREACGESPRIEEYLQRFPQCTDRLIRHFSGRGRGTETTCSPAEELGTPNVRHYETVLSQPEGELATATQARHATCPEIPGFEIESELGRGGMGVVYKARQISADRVVALKVVRSDVLESMPLASRTSTLERFKHEAQAAAKLEHDNLVTVYEVGQAAGLCYYAMKYVEGRSLYDMLRDGPLENRRAARYLEPIARALHVAHQKGILHRDLKPHNILVDQRSDRPLLADFGLAKFVERQQDLTLAGEVMGTPSYMSPEQALHPAQVKAAADVYSLGATLYHVITGRPPFLSASLAETIRQICELEPVPPWVLNPDIDRDLETICLKCLQKEPSRRYASAEALADDLARYLDGRPILARPVGAIERAWRWCRRNPRLAGMIATAATFAIVAVVAIVVGYVQTAAALARAEKNLQQALAVVDDLLTEFSENELINEPGMKPLRKVLLDKALAHYNVFLAENRDNPAVQREVANAYFRVGLITSEIGARDAALLNFNQASKLQQELLKASPDDPERLSALANSLTALGNQYKEVNSFDEAARHYNEALAIRTRLIQLAPKDPNFARLLANVRMNLGVVEMWRGQTIESRKLMSAAQESRILLLQADPKFDNARRDLGRGYSNLADLAMNEGKVDEAARHVRNAIAQFDILLENNPRSLTDRYYRVLCYRSLGGIEVIAERPSDARKMYQKAHDEIQWLTSHNPDVNDYQSELAMVAMSRAAFYEENQDLPAALQSLSLAHDTLDLLVKREPKTPAYRRDLAATLAESGRILLLSGETAKAEEKLTQARNRLEKLLSDEFRNSEFLQHLLDDTLQNLNVCAEQRKKTLN